MSVEQAAERLREHIRCDIAGERDPYVAKWREESVIYDLAVLSRAYLDLFDPTPLSAKILLASGFDKTIRGFWMIPGDHLKPHLEPCSHGGFHLFAFGVRFGTIDTAGDLRRLLSALRIDCEVVVPESEESNG